MMLVAKRITRRPTAPSTRKQRARTRAHGISALLWLSSLNKAVKKGGTYWLPVIVGALGHIATEMTARNK
jgi:hypothetical protein